MKKLLKFISIPCTCFLLIFAISIGVLAYFGFIPGLSELTGANKPKDLGIKYTKTDYNSGIKKLGIKIIDSSVVESVNEAVAEIAKHLVKNTFTSQEITALANKKASWGSFPIRETQIRINADNSFELSGVLKINLAIDYLKKLGVSEEEIKKAMEYVKLPMKDLPIYVKALGSITNNQVSLNFQNLEIGRFPIPINIINQYIKDLNSLFSQSIEKDFKSKINSLTIKQGLIYLDAMVPNEERIKTKQSIL